MSGMPPGLSHLVALAGANLAVTVAVCAVALGLTTYAAVAAKRALKGHKAADLLTFTAATLATAVAANGMWRFTGNVLHFSGPERVLFFAFLEIVVLTCAARAREHIRQALAEARQARDRGEDPGPVGAGADGVAIWIVSGMSGVFSAWDAGSAGGAVFRLGPPLIAAWLWERGLYADMRAAGASRRWRMLADRLLIRLGLAEPDRHTVGEAAARWRLMRLARAVARADRGGKHRRRVRRWRVGALTVAANERAGLVTEPGRYELLMEYIGALRGVDTLIALRPPAPWDAPDFKRAWKASRVMPGDVPGTVNGASGEAPAGAGVEHAPGITAKPPGAPTRARPKLALKLPASKSRNMTAEQLAPHVGAMLEAHGTVSQPQVKTDLHVGTAKAAEALRLALAERRRATVTPIDRAARS